MVSKDLYYKINHEGHGENEDMIKEKNKNPFVTFVLFVVKKSLTTKDTENTKIRN